MQVVKQVAQEVYANAGKRDAEAAVQKAVEERIRPDEKYREDYIRKLVHPDEGGMGEINLFDYLHGMEIENLQDFYLDGKNLFTDRVSNADRLKIVQFFMGSRDVSLWPDLSRQVRFIMPQEAKGHDIAWTVEILTNISPIYREKVVTVANRFFSPRTQNEERCYILAALCKKENLSLGRLDEIDRYDQRQRDEFVGQCVPPGFQSGGRIVYRFDSILEQGWGITYV
ncbi:MAG: hypothetical protein JSS30_05475 [Verrucomicrobia bacterium]|nr:hypothetical protein [Verrucomicrobiota bacterium]